MLADHHASRLPGYDHAIKFWEAPSGICQRTLQHPESQVNKLEITPDKQQIAAAGNPSLRLFDIATGSATSYDGHTNNVTAIGFQKDGKWFFTGSEDGTIKIVTAVLRMHQRCVHCTAAALQGRCRLAAGDVS